MSIRKKQEHIMLVKNSKQHIPAIHQNCLLFKLTYALAQHFFKTPFLKQELCTDI